MSERGRAALRALFERFQEAPEKLLEINDTLQAELDHIQMTLDQIAESLDLNPELGH